MRLFENHDESVLQHVIPTRKNMLLLAAETPLIVAACLPGQAHAFVVRHAVHAPASVSRSMLQQQIARPLRGHLEVFFTHTPVTSRPRELFRLAMLAGSLDFDLKGLVLFAVEPSLMSQRSSRSLQILSRSLFAPSLCCFLSFVST